MPSDHLPHPGDERDDARGADLITYVRLPRELVDRIDAHADELSKRASGVPVTRSKTIAVLLAAALDAERAA